MEVTAIETLRARCGGFGLEREKVHEELAFGFFIGAGFVGQI